MKKTTTIREEKKITKREGNGGQIEENIYQRKEGNGENVMEGNYRKQRALLNNSLHSP